MRGRGSWSRTGPLGPSGIVRPTLNDGMMEMDKMARDVKVFALSTCGHCRNTRKWLDEHKIKYDCTEVDLLHGDEKRKGIDEMRKWNPSLTFPTVILDGKEIIIGFHPEKLEEAFKDA